ncbi:MAG: glycerol kinase GlpK [Candidatus Heimdallarchaeota archaeon]|nr:glycerol kinase GlpK [Candidatus Heimdallarchaeota archaeon]
MNLILSIDQGTTGTRSIFFNSKGEAIAKSYNEHEQIYPSPGWVEHNPSEIWNNALKTINGARKIKSVDLTEISGIGITNQRETIVAWDKNTGIPLHNAIVWQCRRTAEYCDELKNEGFSEIFRKKTGLILDPYFSGTKVRWLLDNSEKVKTKLNEGSLAVGTIDSWLIYNLTGNHITDYSNASRTLLFDINSGIWDDELLEILKIPKHILPEVRPSSDKETYGNTQTIFNHPIPVAGTAGDQQAALFGQNCFELGEVKNTYGTGNFMLMNTRGNAIQSENGLLTTIAWKIDGEIVYALEGSVFITGAGIQWLEQGLGILGDKSELTDIMNTLSSTDGVYFVPAFVGLGAPDWDPYARGTIIGLTRGTTRKHIIRATLESICYQSEDVFQAMRKDSGIDIPKLRVDGGVTNCSPLLQFQADISNVQVQKPLELETTALGAAYLAGLAVGYWENLADIKRNFQIDQEFSPSMEENKRHELKSYWKKAKNRAKSWINN